MSRGSGRNLKTRWITAIVVVALIAIVTLFAVATFASDSGSPAADTPTDCVFTGTPAPQPSPIVLSGCTPGAVDTPVAAAGLVVSLHLSSNKAAPQDVTFTIMNSAGQAVTGATVTMVNTHLEMHHGDFIHLLPEQSPGVYFADGVGMGMGGRWQTRIRIERPGQPEIDVVYLVTLVGLE